MEALLVDTLPTGEEWQYEPKWDGFRCLAFRDGKRVDLMSKAGKPLGRYFPEVVATMLALSTERIVIDSEIVIPEGNTLSFDELLLRIHPAKSRVAKLANEHPAALVVFDLLVNEKGESLVNQPFAKRRVALEKWYADAVPNAAPIWLSPATHSMATVNKWFRSVGGGLDGVVAKRVDIPYESGERAMRKMKQMRTADCVVGGFRYARNARIVGSLLLGLYDDDGLLNHVGFSSNMKAAEREKLTPKLEKLIRKPGFTGQAPGGPSRWSTEWSAEWEPLAPKLVVEVQYDHFSGGRFRHGTSFVRWRPDKAPNQCTMEQVRQEGRSALKLIAPGR